DQVVIYAIISEPFQGAPLTLERYFFCGMIFIVSGAPAICDHWLNCSTKCAASITQAQNVRENVTDRWRFFVVVGRVWGEARSAYLGINAKFASRPVAGF